MTVQFKVEWNGYDAGGVYTLSAPEETRLIAAGIAFNYVPVTQVQAGLTSAQLAAGAVAPAAVSSTGSILGADGAPVSGGAQLEDASGTVYSAKGYNPITAAIRRDSSGVLGVGDAIFAPTDIAGCAAWYDAAVGALKANFSRCTANGDAVSIWEDQSGNGRHLTVASGSPVFSASGGFQGAPGVTGRMVSPAFIDASYNSGFSFFIVRAAPTGFVVSWAATGGFYDGFNSSNGNRYHNYTGLSGGGQNVAQGGDGGGISALVFDGANITSSVGMFGSSSNSGINSMQIATTGSLGLATSNALYVGGHNVGGYDWGVPISELIVFSRGLTSAEIRRIYEYLCAKYIKRKLVRLLGNSLTAGTNSTGGGGQALSSSGTNYPAELIRQAGGAYDVRTDCLPGITTQALFASTATYSYLLDRGTKGVDVIWEITNDLAANLTAAQAYNAIVKFAKSRKTPWRKVLVCTCLKRLGTSNDTKFEALRQAVNALLIANATSFCDGVIDLASDSRLSDPNNTTYFGADKIHLTDAGYVVVGQLVAAPVAAALATIA
jgi:hypothetical protein